MPAQLAMFGLMSLFIADYVGMVVWLMRTTTNNPERSIRYSLRTMLVVVTLVSIHLGLFAAVLSEISSKQS